MVAMGVGVGEVSSIRCNISHRCIGGCGLRDMDVYPHKQNLR